MNVVLKFDDYTIIFLKPRSTFLPDDFQIFRNILPRLSLLFFDY